jgi:hypothetical protein
LPRPRVDHAATGIPIRNGFEMGENKLFQPPLTWNVDKINAAFRREIDPALSFVKSR